MRITAIKPQQRRTDRLSIYIDGKYSFSLSELELTKLDLRVDQKLTATELKNLQVTAQTDKAYDRALRYVELRPRSEQEIIIYLKRKGYEEAVVKLILTKLEKLELINDKVFADQWVEWRLHTTQRSRRQLRMELLQKGVAGEIVNEVLQGHSEAAELEQLKNLVQRKRRLSQYQDRQKLMAYLARRGYSYDLIKQALAE